MPMGGSVGPKPPCFDCMSPLWQLGGLFVRLLLVNTPIRKLLLAVMALVALVSIMTRPRASERSGAPLLAGAHVPAAVRVVIGAPVATAIPKRHAFPGTATSLRYRG